MMRHAEPWSLPLDVRLMNLTSRLLIGVTVIGMCFSGAVWLIGQPQFNLRVIQIQGQGELEHVNEATLRMAIASKVKGNFFTVNLDEVKTVFESAPWVRQASVRRIWPYGLNVLIQEYQPVALWGHDRQTSYLLDAYGTIFEANAADVDDKHLPLFNGPESEGSGEKMWQVYSQLNQVLYLLDQEIDELRLSEQGTWSMVLADGTQVIIGRGDLNTLVKRVESFVHTVQVALKPYGQRTLLRADLRHTNGYAVQITDVETVRAQPAVQQRRQ